MSNISVVINTLNEEKNLPKAISSVRSFANEVVVVDMMSSDDTRKLARNLGAKVYEHKKEGYVEPARNFAIEKASGNWILILDADERVPKSLASKLQRIVEESKKDYFRLPRKNIIFGKWLKHSRWWPDYNIRFFRKGNVKWSEIIHSVPETRGSGADLEASEKFALEHHHYDSIEQYINRMNRYTTQHAYNLSKEGYKFNWDDLIKKPTTEFLSRYFQGEGYKDGVHGLALSSLQAFSELVLYLKVWGLEKYSDKNISIHSIVGAMKEKQSDFNYWHADALLKHGGGVKQRVKRKLKLK